MSALLDDLIQKRKRNAIDYQTYLARIVALTRRINAEQTETSYPPRINTGALRSLFDNIMISDDSELAESSEQYETHPNGDIREQVAVALDRAIRDSREDDWRGHKLKERKVRLAMSKVVAEEFGDYAVDVDALFELAKNQHEY